MPGREPRTYLAGLDPTGPTNVTAVVKSQTNRARSVAAGVVSGAGCCQPVIQRPHFDESVSSRIAPKLDQSEGETHPGQGSPGGGCVLRVVPGTIAHTKETTGLTYLKEVVGRWIQTPPAHRLARELRSRRRAWGQAAP